MTPTPADKPPSRALFSTIAARYDRCNHLFSLGIDRYWRKQLAQMLVLKADDAVLDICCGTGDMALSVLIHTPVHCVWGIDCSETMIQLAQEKRIRRAGRGRLRGKTLRLSVQDAAALAFEPGMFAAVTCAFGLRNIPDRARVLAAVFRVLAPGGQVGICEFSLPRFGLLRSVYWAYLSRVMPLAGRVVIGDAEPLRYLARSIDHWHKTVRLEEELAGAGFVDCRCRLLTGGIVTLTVARKPGPLAAQPFL
jgi:demethylmenaquinone methyltransferase/2-methoxy-6-polyprenyl-1,4-benzoquinol methylase